MFPPLNARKNEKKYSIEVIFFEQLLFLSSRDEIARILAETRATPVWRCNNYGLGKTVIKFMRDQGWRMSALQRDSRDYSRPKGPRGVPHKALFHKERGVVSRYAATSSRRPNARDSPARVLTATPYARELRQMLHFINFSCSMREDACVFSRWIVHGFTCFATRVDTTATAASALPS